MMVSDGLGLVLTRTQTHGSKSVLQLMFGMMQSSTFEYLVFCAQILIVDQHEMDDLRIKRPYDDEIHIYQKAMMYCNHELDGCLENN